MNESEQVEAFVGDLQKVVDRYREEFNLTLAAAIGGIEILKLHLWREQSKPNEE